MTALTFISATPQRSPSPNAASAWCLCRDEFGPILGEPSGMAQGAWAGPCTAPSITPAAPGDPASHPGSNLGLQTQGFAAPAVGRETQDGENQVLKRSPKPPLVLPPCAQRGGCSGRTWGAVEAGGVMVFHSSVIRIQVYPAQATRQRLQHSYIYIKKSMKYNENKGINEN